MGLPPSPSRHPPTPLTQHPLLASRLSRTSSLLLPRLLRTSSAHCTPTWPPSAPSSTRLSLPPPSPSTTRSPSRLLSPTPASPRPSRTSLLLAPLLLPMSSSLASSSQLPSRV